MQSNNTILRILAGGLLLVGLWTPLRAQQNRQFTQQILLDKPVEAGPLKLFPDLNNPHEYYYLPNHPRLATHENGLPVFSFTRFVENIRSGAAEEEAREGNGGGIIHVVFGLSVTPEQLQEGRQELRRKDASGRIVGPVIYRSGTVALITSPPQQGGRKEVVGLGPAPLIDGDNIAVSMLLSKKEAKILWETFKSSTPDISFTFNMELAGFLSPVKATITVDREQIVRHQNFQLGLASPVLSGEIDIMVAELIDKGAIKITQVGEDIDQQRLVDNITQQITAEFFSPMGSTLLASADLSGNQGESALDRATRMVNNPGSSGTSPLANSTGVGSGNTSRSSSTTGSTPVPPASAQRTNNPPPRPPSSSTNPTPATSGSSTRAAPASPGASTTRPAGSTTPSATPPTSSGGATSSAASPATPGGSSSSASTGSTTAPQTSPSPSSSSASTTGSTSTSGTSATSGNAPATGSTSTTGRTQTAGTSSTSTSSPTPGGTPASGSTSRNNSPNTGATPVNQSGTSAINNQGGQAASTGNPSGQGRQSLAIVASYRSRSITQRGTKTVNLEKFQPAVLPQAFSGNIGPIDCADCFREINLQDPLYQQREIVALLDGMNARDFGEFINYVTVILRKRHASGEVSYDEVRIDRNNFNREGNHFKLLYGWKGDNDRRRWLDYEYRTIWSYFGGYTREEEWQPAQAAVINLTPHFQRRVVQLEADSSLIRQANIRTIDVKVFYRMGESEQVRQVTLSANRRAVGGQLEFMLPPQATGYEYEIIWHLNGNRIVSTGRQRTEGFALLIDELPDH